MSFFRRIVTQETNNHDPIRVTYEFCLPEHENELKKYQLVDDMMSSLFDIDDICRNYLKNRDYNEDTEIFIQSIREMVSASGVNEIE